MARIFVAAFVAILLFGGVIAADQSLQNPDIQSSNATTAAQQTTFAETASPLIQGVVPVVVFSMVIGSVLAAVRVMQ
jgi:hypothetical protein